MTGSTDPPWVNYDEAMSRVRACKDAALEQFIMRGVTIVVTDFQRGHHPDAPLDMLYIVELLTKMFEQREALTRILGGEDLRWWGDDKS